MNEIGLFKLILRIGQFKLMLILKLTDKQPALKHVVSKHSKFPSTMPNYANNKLQH